MKRAAVVVIEVVAPSVAKLPSWTVLPVWSVTVLLAVIELNSPMSMFVLMSRMGTLIVPPVSVRGVVRVRVPAVAERVRLVPSVCVPARSKSSMLGVIVGAVAKLIVPADQLKTAPLATFTMFRFSVPPVTFTLALVRKLVVPLRFIVAPVPMFSVADAAGATARLPPMLATPVAVAVKVAGLPLIEIVPTLPSSLPTSRSLVVTEPLARMLSVPLPKLPTRRGVFVMVQAAFTPRAVAPATVAVPTPVVLRPMAAPLEVASVLPFCSQRFPVPALPM